MGYSFDLLLLQPSWRNQVSSSVRLLLCFLWQYKQHMILGWFSLSYFRNWEVILNPALLSLPFLLYNHQVLSIVFSKDISNLFASAHSTTNLVVLDISHFACTANILIHSLLSKQNFVWMQVTSNDTPVWHPSVTSVDHSSQPSVHSQPFCALLCVSEGIDCISRTLLTSGFPPKIIYSFLTWDEVDNSWHRQKSAWKTLHDLSDWGRALILPLSPSLTLTVAYQFLNHPKPLLFPWVYASHLFWLDHFSSTPSPSLISPLLILNAPALLLCPQGNLSWLYTPFHTKFFLCSRWHD